MGAVIHLADHSARIRDRVIAGHQAELLTAPYRSGLAVVMTSALFLLLPFLARGRR